ncbi:sulfotransferase family protein [Hansschlegelia zhihuaiae]|uniref:Sulfotransferase n=1 Tax=Hansschlegelia zhihuaiae TaxID=405005 RepID=A0A4Q0MBU1_9HYPH|nr:sulfotransferase [Hansschlegelia zhihuaiae]RXF70781.1 sulfotransferase [Hansschlegelia zhihuaiae]
MRTLRTLVPPPRSTLHPLAGAEYETVKRVLRRNDRIRAAHFGLLAVSWVATRFRRPFIEKATAAAAEVPDDWHRTTPPIFVLGFWRSGTTLLHELLAADPDLAGPSLIDVLFPADAPYLARYKRRFVGGILPPTRVTDLVEVSPRSIQEEELAISNLGGPSFFAVTYFPRRYDEAVEEAMFFDGAPEARAEWRAAHGHFMKLLNVKYPGRRLLLKNPANCTRIPELLALYPDAYFVRTERAAEEVIPSFMRMQRLGDGAFSLQGRPRPRDRAAAERFHARVTGRLEEDWALISPDRRATVRYEDVIESPVQTVAGIYRDLGLEFTPTAKKRVRAYWNRKGKARTPQRIPPDEDVPVVGV